MPVWRSAPGKRNRMWVVSELARSAGYGIKAILERWNTALMSLELQRARLLVRAILLLSCACIPES